MQARIVSACCVAFICISTIPACQSGPKTRSGTMDALSIGMSRAEVRATLSRDPAWLPPYTLVRNAEGAFVIQGMGDDTVLRLAERALRKRGREYAERVKTIDVTEGPRNTAGGYDLLSLFYDQESILLDILEGHVDVNVRSMD